MQGIFYGSGEKFWTEERIAELRRLAGERMFARDIAAEIGTTKNSVLGKLHRLGLSKAKALPTRKPKISRRVRPKRNGGAAVAALKARKEQERKIANTVTSTWGRKAVIARAIARGELEPCEATDLPPEPTRPTISLHNLQSHHCRWPIGDPQQADFHFCGKTKVAGLPYCEFHARRAFQPPQVSRSRAARSHVPVSAPKQEEPVS
jgi:GcrA cell cycle regulator